MLFQLIYFCFISFFCLTWGLPIVFTIDRKKKLSLQTILLGFFVGLAALSILAAWVSLFVAVRFEVLFFFSVPVILWNAKKTKALKIFQSFKFSPLLQKVSKIELVFIAVCILLFCFLSTGKPTMEDTDLYHIQSIKWIHEWGTVPGLANLYLRFGFYSNWFHAISFFDVPFLNKNFLYLNFTFVVWMFLFLFYQYKKSGNAGNSVQKHLSVFFLFVLFFMLMKWDLFRVGSSSTSYDFVVSGMVLICISLLLEKIIGSANSNHFTLLFLLLTTPFYKLTGFFILPFWFFIFYGTSKKIRTVLFSLFITVLCFIPFAIKNLIQTGYPFYPYKFLDFLKPGWQVPSSMVDLFNKYILLSNHYINQSIPGFPLTDGSSFSFIDDWFLHLVKADQVLIFFCFTSLPLAWVILKKIYNQNFLKILVIYLLCIPAFIAWLIASPDPRFAFGFLIFMVFFPLTSIVSMFIKKWMLSVSMVLISLLGIVYIVSKAQKQFSLLNVLQPTVIEVPQYKTVTINNKSYYIPQILGNNWNPRCINDPLPCIYDQNPYLKPRGKELGDGFEMIPLPDSAFILKYYY